MDLVSRLIRLVLSAGLFFLATAAQAVYVDRGPALYNVNPPTLGMDAACSNAAASVGAGFTGAKTGGPDTAQQNMIQCTIYYPAASGGGAHSAVYPKRLVCSSGATVQNVAGDWRCMAWESVCPADTHEMQGGNCVPKPPVVCEPEKTLGDSSSKWYWKGKGSTTCQQGCLYIADQFAYDKQSGYSVGWGRLNGLGAKCTTGQESAGDNPPDNKPPNKCDPGKCTGTINGVAVCVKCGNGGSVDQKSETTTKDPDGEGGEPGETTSTKTDTKTTCDDGKCQTTTTTTTTNGDGTTKTETKTEDQSRDEFCAKNPDHALCKEEESKFEGGCQSGFRCEGDAVQCAIAREQHQRMCQLLDTETDLSTLGKRVGSGEDAADVRAQLGTGVAPVDVSGQLASATPLGPNSGCPADVSVGNWTIPFSRMCPHLNTLGNALIGLSWLVAALIVFRRAD